MEFIAVLVRIQLNLPRGERTDEAFAATLGVPRTTWYGYKHGKPFPVSFVRKAVTVYPQVEDAARRLLLPSRVDILTKTGGRKRRAS